MKTTQTSQALETFFANFLRDDTLSGTVDAELAEVLDIDNTPTLDHEQVYLIEL